LIKSDGVGRIYGWVGIVTLMPFGRIAGKRAPTFFATCHGLTERGTFQQM